MNSHILQKMLRLKPWHVLVLAIVFSEIFTAALNTIMGVIWWGEVSVDLLQIGIIDAFIVSLVVAAFVIYAVRLSTKLLAEKEFLKQEIVDRTVAEEALRESREKYYQLFENESDALLVFDALSMQFEDANQATLDLFGYTKEEFLALKVTDISAEEDETLVSVQGVIEGKPGSNRVPLRYMRKKDGTVFPTEISAGSFFSKERKKIIGAVRDITERKRAEEALRESSGKYYQLFESASDAVLIFDALTLQIEDANRAALDMYGYTKDELLALKVPDLSAEKEKTKSGLRKVIAGEPGSGRVPLRYIKRKDGTVFPAEISSGAFLSKGRKKIIGAVRDITERTRAEEEKRKLAQLYYHSQKLEALGTLAGGIAHDVNNLMGIILSNTELARMKAPENIHPYLDRAISAVERGKDIVRNLMNFPNGVPSAQGPVDLVAVTRETVRLLMKDTDEGIAVRVDAPPGLRPVQGNAAELQQMVLNLYLNARDAVAKQMLKGGKSGFFIHFTLDNVSIPEAHLPESMRHRSGDFVRLAVKDNGCGMDGETASRIFEPYFTTKGEEGSGLGLSTVWSIVKQSSGWIDVKGTPGEGAEFQVYLPWWKEDIPAEELHRFREQVGGAETVLIVDDEQHIANASREMLEHLGYNVLVAYSGEEALGIYREKRDSIDLVFSDIVMPDKSGIRLLSEIKGIDPDVKIMLTSGKEFISRGGAAELQGIGFLPKPYSLNEFSSMVRSMLGERAAAKTMKDHLNKINFYCVKEKTLPFDERVINSDTIYKIFKDRLSSEVKERFIVVLLDSEKRIIAYEEVGSGTVGEAFVYIREVIRSAIITNAHSIVLIHNHTSGVPKPSLEDIRLTLEISKACSIHNIKLLDHLIIGKEDYCSFSHRGLL